MLLQGDSVCAGELYDEEEEDYDDSLCSVEIWIEEGVLPGYGRWIPVYAWYVPQHRALEIELQWNELGYRTRLIENGEVVE